MTQDKAQEIFAALEKFIAQRSGMNCRDYGTDGRRAYQSAARSVTADGRRARTALAEARSLQPARYEVLLDSFRAFSGRLTWDTTYYEILNDDGSKTFEGKLDYTAGQYFPTEYRKAAASVLETYCAGWRQAENAANPKTFTYTTIADVIAANQSIGYHFFDHDTMRSFGTKIESTLLAGHRFVTSEKNYDGTKRFYTIREALPDGRIETVGEFQAYTTRRAALVDVLKEAASV